MLSVRMRKLKVMNHDAAIDYDNYSALVWWVTVYFIGNRRLDLLTSMIKTYKITKRIKQ